MQLDTNQVKQILPHREPMLMIDTAHDLIPGESVTAEKHFDEKWEVYCGHFPSSPVTPGIFLVEAMAQAADIVLLSLPENAGKLPLFLGISRVRFLRPVPPGSDVTITAVLSQTADGGVYECTSSVFVEGRKVASGLVTLALR